MKYKVVVRQMTQTTSVEFEFDPESYLEARSRFEELDNDIRNEWVGKEGGYNLFYPEKDKFCYRDLRENPMFEDVMIVKV